jgi:quercetin dioxygenase-like cupin family protein
MWAVSALLWIILPPLASQTPPVIPVDQEPHQHLVLQNTRVKVFEAELAPHEAFPLHRHENDDLSVLLGPATTVSSTPGLADVLTISKPADVIFTPSGLVHSVRNIGQTPYHLVTIELLQRQTGSYAFCGTQLSKLDTECRAIRENDSGLLHFSTDQVLVTLITIGPHQGISLGETHRDMLIVAVDAGSIAPSAGKGLEKIVSPGSPAWIPRGSAKQVLKNNSDKQARVVTIEFKR